MKKICKFCGKEFITRKRKAKYCSRTCVYKALSEFDEYIGRNSTHWKGGKVKVNCRQCGKELDVFSCELNDEGKKFCSYACYHSSKGSEHRKCLMCGKDILVTKSAMLVGKRKFCSRKCYQIAQATEKYIKQNHSCWKENNNVCKMCGKTFHIKSYATKKGWGKFCSKKCYVHAQRDGWYMGEKSANWQGGISFEPYPIEFNNSFKKIIVERDNHVCQICKVDESKTKRKHAVHHIDYDKENTTQINCILLCNYCHGLTQGSRKIWQDVLKEYQELRFS